MRPINVDIRDMTVYPKVVPKNNIRKYVPTRAATPSGPFFARPPPCRPPPCRPGRAGASVAARNARHWNWGWAMADRRETIGFDDFLKLDIRVGTVVRAEPFAEARQPAYKVWVDFGAELGVKKTSAQATAH